MGEADICSVEICLSRKKEEARHESRLTMSSCPSDIFNIPFKTPHLIKKYFQIVHPHNLETIHASMLSMSSCPSDIYYPANHRCCPILLTGKGKARKKKQTPSSCNKTSSGCHMPRLAERICCKLVSKTPPVVTYPRQNWILTRKLSIRLRYFAEVNFFGGPKLSCKVCFFRRDYMFQTFF